MWQSDEPNIESAIQFVFCDDATVFGDVLKDFDVGDGLLIETITFLVILGGWHPNHTSVPNKLPWPINISGSVLIDYYILCT